VLLGKRVDLSEEGMLKPRVRSRVEPEAVRALQISIELRSKPWIWIAHRFPMTSRSTTQSNGASNASAKRQLNWRVLPKISALAFRREYDRIERERLCLVVDRDLARLNIAVHGALARGGA
jgi:hypothetical protein